MLCVDAKHCLFAEEPESTKKRSAGKSDGGATKRPKPAAPAVGPDGEPLSRGQQRKISTQERRSSKKGSEVVENLRSRWEKLRIKHMDKEERRVLIDEAMAAVSGRVHDIIFKHDASRVVQSCLKYGTTEQRAAICAELKDHYVQLARSPYGKYLVAKVLKFCPAARPDVVAGFRGHCVALLRHAESSGLVDETFTLYARAPERAAMLREFGGAEFSLFKDADAESVETLVGFLERNPSKRTTVINNLRDNLQDLLNKGSGRLQMVHALLHDYLLGIANPKERDDFHADVCEHIAELIHTRKGAEVAMACLLHGSAKDRKVMLRAMKEAAAKIAEDEYGHVVMLRALEVVDDTVLLHKSLLLVRY